MPEVFVAAGSNSDGVSEHVRLVVFENQGGTFATSFTTIAEQHETGAIKVAFDFR